MAAGAGAILGWEAWSEYRAWFDRSHPELQIGKNVQSAAAVLELMEGDDVFKFAMREAIDGLYQEFQSRLRAIQDRERENFPMLWAFMRNFLPLQSRLFFEQVYWRMGQPWKRLVTGFNAVDPELMSEFAKYQGVGSDVPTLQKGRPR